MKNPAVLWYPSDFIASTSFWTNEQCGAYIRLLNYQFVLGHLTEEQINKITDDKTVTCKFIKDKNGLFFNKRMELEINKRTKYSKSRSKNRLGKTKEKQKKDMNNICKTYENHMGNINGNININNNIYTYYSNNINNSISGIEYEKLNNWLKIFNEDIIKYAIDISVTNKARNINYIGTILNNWEKSGYNTLDEIKESYEKKDSRQTEQQKIYEELRNEHR